MMSRCRWSEEHREGGEMEAQGVDHTCQEGTMRVRIRLKRKAGVNKVAFL